MKRIGIVGHLINSEKTVTFGIGFSYYAYFSALGSVEIIGHNETEARDLDLLVIPGGPDVDVSRYLEPGEEVSIHVGAPCWIREKFDRDLLPKYVAQNTPIFGICRGHQSLAVYFGGKLKQHMHHETNPSNDRKKLVHKIFIQRSVIPFATAPATVKKGHVPVLTQEVNSIHHQTVSEIPEIGELLAFHSVDREVEAISYVKNYPAITVQWHPEEINDPLSAQSINYLLNLKK